MSDKPNLTEERVDPRIKRTRQLLLKAFEELLAEKSLEAITVQDIADRATVNRATFYAHFEDKYDLLDQAFEETFAQALHKNLPPGSEFSPTNLRLLIQSTCEFLEQLHNHCAHSSGTEIYTRLEQGMRQQLHDVLVQWMKPAGNAGLLRPDPELRATVTSWAVYGACLWWSQQAHREPAPEFARKVLPLITAAFDPQSGIPLKASSSKVVSIPR